MKTRKANLKAVMTQLEEAGTAGARKIYAQQGAGVNQFGVSLGNLRGLARRLKPQHTLAMDLWATGNTDARILATMLMAPDQLSALELERMAKPLGYFRLMDELVFNVIARSPHADALRARWTESPAEMIGRGGWNLLIDRITRHDIAGLDLDAILRQIEAEILTAPKRKQDAMNRCLVEIGVHFQDYTARCIALGERLGRFDPTPVPKGCVSSYAPEWIAAVLKTRPG